MARKRTKDQKVATQRKRSQDILPQASDQPTVSLSYQAPKDSGIKPTPPPASVLVQRDQTEAILRQPIKMIYQDLARTSLVIVGIIGILVALVQYLK